MLSGADHKPDDKEAAAETEALKEGLMAPGRLFREVVQSGLVDVSNVGAALVRDRRDMFDGLRDVARVRGDHTSHDEAVMFKGQVLLVGEAVVEVSGRRFGGKVSDEESEAWSRAAHALGHRNDEFKRAPARGLPRLICLGRSARPCSTDRFGSGTCCAEVATSTPTPPP